MIYVKSMVDGREIRTGLTDNCFFSDCPICGNQTPVEFNVLAQIVGDGELEETSVYCDPCSEKYQNNKKPQLSLVK